jgi:hypothetical protein
MTTKLYPLRSLDKLKVARTLRKALQSHGKRATICIELGEGSYDMMKRDTEPERLFFVGDDQVLHIRFDGWGLARVVLSENGKNHVRVDYEGRPPMAVPGASIYSGSEP